MLREVLGKYPPILEEVMANDPSGQPKACLDLGCGSGGWLESPICLLNNIILTS